ncbi:MAG: sugar phosphate isomerase/epimerase, partial [Oscillospiraceae bacterium]|nr:sugar phosphate isomerase/epimerase [Oscillospiraceae bacterium]
MKIKTGYHAVYAENYFSGIDDAKKYGFEFVQFELGVPAYFLNKSTKEKLLEIKKYAEDSGVEVTFHSPADNMSLFSDYPLIRMGILDETKAMLEMANIIGARHMTFHTGVYSKFKKSGEKAKPFYAEHYEKVLYENLKTLINASGDVLVCVENDSLDDVSRLVIQRLIDENERLYLTLDTAKMY